ncbi:MULTISPECIES: hypothetical protein [Methanothermobacter]|uniref:Uncharacterized protein n=1 Tax=Methanothermobacter wolfeii TaxID=145261 RepID=A0A9E7UG06_METWO|nr:hypothetical protein [Methanothermobacter wolfeii]UXH31204.1 hypothetical protein N5910_06580 [Methanothermobacter wolfeii]
MATFLLLSVAVFLLGANHAAAADDILTGELPGGGTSGEGDVFRVTAASPDGVYYTIDGSIHHGTVQSTVPRSYSTGQ